MIIVKLLSAGVPRVLDGIPGMTFMVDEFTPGAEGPVAHVRDYRFDKSPGGFQIWSIGAKGYQQIFDNRGLT